MLVPRDRHKMKQKWNLFLKEMCHFSSYQWGGVPAIPNIICMFIRHESEAQSLSPHYNKKVGKHFSIPSYGAPFASKLFANVLFNVVVTYPIKCSCDSINQPLLFFTLISFYCRDVTFSTLTSFYYRHGTFSTLISFYCRDETFSTLISFYCRDVTFSTLTSFYCRDAIFSTLI